MWLGGQEAATTTWEIGASDPSRNTTLYCTDRQPPTVTAPREVWLRQAGRAAALLSTLAGAVWLSGLPLLFPSLGPTAYLFATKPAAPECAPRRVVGGHAIGVVAGFVAFHATGGGVALGSLTTPGSVAALGLAVSGVVAVGLTTAGMVATDTGHAPACATTLIVSLGILTTPRAALLIVVAVVVLVAENAALLRVTGGAGIGGPDSLTE